MPRSTATQPEPGVDSSSLQEQVRILGNELGAALRELIDALPGAPHTPTPLARRLGMSRVITSKLLNSIARTDPVDLIQQVPGPESLRTLTVAAAELHAPEALVSNANQAIDRFATLIRQDFGTRGALNAAISTDRPDLQLRFELASRYHVHKGMTEILGVEAEAWLTCMFFAPAPNDEQSIAVTTIHGGIGIRRLRPDVNVYFTFGPPHHPPGVEPDPLQSPVGLQEFYANDPAPFETYTSGNQLVHRLAHDRLGRKSIVDMIAVSHNAKGARRYATPERPRGGAIVFPDIPVKMLIVDALIHDTIFPGADPELIVYNPGGRGPANPADRRRDIDRIAVPEQIELLNKSQGRFSVDEVPHYADMIDRVCATIGHKPSEFRLCRLRMAYPVHGFQFVMAFDAPPMP